jgi:hypothetical protein
LSIIASSIVIGKSTKKPHPESHLRGHRSRVRRRRRRRRRRPRGGE